MQKNDNDMIIAEGKDLFNRVVSIFEQAQVNAYERFATLEVANSYRDITLSGGLK
ncbi:MAG: hypothetical protein GQ534_10005 [Candidatus Delongbacteria bacterium]|nr:hypothetical protein [Candidatus Delongbacteria bacterium]